MHLKICTLQNPNANHLPNSLSPHHLLVTLFVTHLLDGLWAATVNRSLLRLYFMHHKN
jgi:hypothetical protein